MAAATTIVTRRRCLKRLKLFNFLTRIPKREEGGKYGNTLLGDRKRHELRFAIKREKEREISKREINGK